MRKMEKYIERKASKINSNTLLGFWHYEIPNRKAPIWGIADVCPELVLVQKGEVLLYRDDNSLLSKSNKAILLGGMEKPFYMECGKNTSLIGLFLQPIAINHLIGVDPSFLLNNAINLSNHSSKHISKLIDLAVEKDAFTLIDNYFKENFSNFQVCEITRLLNEMIIEGYSLKKYDEIRKIEYSSRHLRRMIKSITGFSPNKFFRLCKVRGIIKSVSRTKNLSELTYDFDYFDQAHFIRDFRCFTGRSPKIILKPFMDKGFEWLEQHKIG